MSEYQYYEFQAVDRPLTPEQMGKLRALTTRAVITANSLTNTYTFGDFRGNPRKLMESYFDAHVYVSNFGIVTLMLRLPRAVLTKDMLAPYTFEGLDWWTTDEHIILEWQRDGEPPDEWVDGEGWMAQLLPIRDELVRGDYRSLYIGWLYSIVGASGDDDDGNLGDSRREPPVPAGLGSLTGSQFALAEFLGVSGDLLAAAAEASPELPKQGVSDVKVDAWVAQLPEPEVRAIVARLIDGAGLRMQAELQSRYFRARNESTPGPQADAAESRRTAGELLAQAERTEQERKRREAEERRRKRRAHLSGLVPRFPELWATMNTLAEEKKASSYDKITTLLVDMRDAYAEADRRPDFDAEFTRFIGVHGIRAALVRRLKEVRLL